MPVPNYTLMSEPYILTMNYEDGTSDQLTIPDLLKFDDAVGLADAAIAIRRATGKEPQLTNIFITCDDRLALVVFPNGKRHWPDWSDPWKGYDKGGTKEFRLP